MCWVSEPRCVVSRLLAQQRPQLTKLWRVQNSTASFRQETAAPVQETGGMGAAPGTQFTILWRQGWPEQKNVCPRKLWVIFKPPKILLSWSPFTDFLPTISRTVRFKAFFLSHVSVDVWPHPRFICVRREHFWWDQPQEQLAGKHHDCSAKRYDNNKKNIGSYESSERDEFFHTKEYWFSKKKKKQKVATSEDQSISHEAFSFWCVGPSMEHQHSNRVTEPAPRIVQGMNCC